jgi:hypothetical protein
LGLVCNRFIYGDARNLRVSPAAVCEALIPFRLEELKSLGIVRSVCSGVDAKNADVCSGSQRKCIMHLQRSNSIELDGERRRSFLATMKLSQRTIRGKLHPFKFPSHKK